MELQIWKPVLLLMFSLDLEEIGQQVKDNAKWYIKINTFSSLK